MRSLCGALIAFALLFSLPAYAEEEKPDTGQKLEEVVVTATKTKQEKGQAPASVDVVPGEEIREKNLNFADQGLRELPGVFSERRGGVTGISDSFAPLHLRGTPNASQSLVLLDGQPMNNYEGNVHWWAIPVENIDRVEVVRGPFSSLYGGGAMGGVVNIITKPESPLLGVTYGYGSYHTQLVSATHGWKIGDFTYSISARTLEMEDPEQISTARNPGTNTIALQQADGTTTYLQGYTSQKTTTDALTAGVTWDMTTESALDFKFTHANYKLDPDETQTFDGARLSNSYREHATNTYIVSYRNADIENVEVLFNAGLTHNYKDLFIWNNNSTDSVRPNSHYTAGLQSNLTMGAHVLTLGTDWSLGRMSTVDENILPTPDDDKVAKGKLRTIGLFAQDQWKIVEKVTLYTSARYDSWKAFDADTSSNITGFPVEVSSNSESHISPKLSLVYQPDKFTSIRTSAGEAFRGPTLWEAFKYSRGNRSTSLPNPDLEPEIVRSYEVGFDRNLFTYFDFGATYFVNHFKDLIYQVDVPDVDGDGRDDYLYENVGKAKSKGYELTFGFRPVKEVSFFANHTRIITRVQDVDDPDLAADIEGKEFARVPRYMYNLGTNIEVGPVYSHVVARYVGDSFRDADNGDTIDHSINGNDPYAVMDVSLGFRIKNFELTGAVYNVFGREYWESYDKNPGRTYFVTVTARL